MAVILRLCVHPEKVCKNKHENHNLQRGTNAIFERKNQGRCGDVIVALVVASRLFAVMAAEVRNLSPVAYAYALTHYTSQ